jgi:hypothetical protein
MVEGKRHAFQRDWRKSYPIITKAEGIYLYNRASTKDQLSLSG